MVIDMMTTEQLKNSILQLAMQGKLVEQISEEGTGQELFKKIEKEKYDARTKKEISKDKEVSQVVFENLDFEIPETWKKCCLQDVCALSEGAKVNRVKMPYLEAKYLRGKKEVEIKSEGKLIHKGERAILVDGENSGEVFSIPEDGILGSTFKKLFINPAMVVEYVLFILDYYRPYFRNNKRGSAIPHLDKELFASAPIGIPPLSEQKRIVAKIEELMPFVEQYATASTKLNTLNAAFPEMMKKSILQEAVQGKLVPQDPNDEPASVLLKEIAEEKKRLIKEGKIKKPKPLPAITEDEIPFDIPDNWEWVRLTDIGDVSRGRSQHRPRGDAALYIDGIYPLVQTGDVAAADKYLTGYTTMYNKKGLEQSKMWPKGTLCITIAANIGDVAILDFDACFPDSVVGFTPYTKGVVSEYVYYMLQAFKPILDARSTKVAQKNLNVEKLSNIWFPLPPTEEQKKITIKLDECLTQLQKLDNQASLKK